MIILAIVSVFAAYVCFLALVMGIVDFLDKLCGYKCPHCSKRSRPSWDFKDRFGNPKTSVAYNAKRCSECRAILEERIGYTCPNCQVHEYPVWDHQCSNGTPDRRYAKNSKRCPRCNLVAAEVSKSPIGTVPAQEHSLPQVGPPIKKDGQPIAKAFTVPTPAVQAAPVTKTSDSTIQDKPLSRNAALPPSAPTATAQPAPERKTSYPPIPDKPLSKNASQTGDAKPRHSLSNTVVPVLPPAAPATISDRDTTVREAVAATNVALVHKRMQREIQHCLRAAGGLARRVNVEHSEIDVFVEDLDSAGRVVRTCLIEIKTAESAREAIRQALGQLLEYRYYKRSLIQTDSPRLIVVSPNPVDHECSAYLDSLRQSYRLELEYLRYVPGSYKFSIPERSLVLA